MGKKHQIERVHYEKVLVISGSPRKGGNSDLLCDEFIKGALKAGHQVEKIWLGDKTINFCRACYYCYEKHECFQKMIWEKY